MINELRAQIEKYELLQHQLLYETLKFQDEHEQILNACLRGDPAAARDKNPNNRAFAGSASGTKENC